MSSRGRSPRSVRDSFDTHFWEAVVKESQRTLDDGHDTTQKGFPLVRPGPFRDASISRDAVSFIDGSPPEPVFRITLVILKSRNFKTNPDYS